MNKVKMLSKNLFCSLKADTNSSPLRYNSVFCWSSSISSVCKMTKASRGICHLNVNILGHLLEQLMLPLFFGRQSQNVSTLVKEIALISQSELTRTNTDLVGLYIASLLQLTSVQVVHWLFDKYKHRWQKPLHTSSPTKIRQRQPLEIQFILIKSCNTR